MTQTIKIYYGKNITSKKLSDVFASFLLAGKQVEFKEMKYIDNDQIITKTQSARK
jgi:hypothetical protein